MPTAREIFRVEHTRLKRIHMNIEELEGVRLIAETGMIRLEKGGIRHGDKSDCVNCGDEIPKARLDAMPGTRWCVVCTENHDATKHPRWARAQRARR